MHPMHRDGEVMDTNVGISAARSENTTSVFTTGTAVYLRRRTAGMEKIVQARCVGFGLNRLILQWAESDAADLLPRPDEEVTCQALQHGVLLIAKGTVDDITPGRSPRIHITVEQRCVAVPLRKWPRYTVAGRLSLREPAGGTAYSPPAYLPVNISLGGFGVALPKDAWDGGENVCFTLDLLFERNGEPDQELPGLTLRGAGLVRQRWVTPENALYLGVQFTAVEPDQLQALEFWLAAHSTYLREAK